jgi:hypothetical protein
MAKGDSTEAGWAATIAASALFMAGATHMLVAVQFLLFWWLRTGEFWATVTIGTFGALAIVTAWMLFQGRSVAAIGGTVLAPTLGVLSTAYAIYAGTHGSFALYMFLAPPTAMLATLVVPFSIAPCRRAERALAALRASQGDRPMFGSLG